ncbi:MAG: phospho-sugar mutase [Opitutales bacterium]
MDIVEQIKQAGADGKLLPSTVDALNEWLGGTFLPDWGRKAIEELIAGGHWNELNDRFYQTMAFGTGGLRGRTIGRVVPPSEQGTPGSLGEPEHPAIGTNVLNDFTVVRATLGLFRYAKLYLEENEIFDVPKLVICHDVRHFSRHFCNLAASTWTRAGGLALIFDGPRSTPQLSFSIRQLKTHCGINITASHNPPHDNGYKAYFADGGQIVPPHAGGIVAEVAKVALEEIPPFLDIDLEKVVVLTKAVDEGYLEVLEDNLLDATTLADHPPEVVFTPNHGCGQVSALPLMEAFGIKVHCVPEQMAMDGRFPGTDSANPENREAYTKALELAEQTGAEAVIATDPDADRLGCGARNRAGEMVLYTGNQLGSAIAEYRVSKLKEMGIIPDEGTEDAALIKTFVTTPLQEAIAKAHGLKCVNTLTGFKWIGEKLNEYEELLRDSIFEEEGVGLDYDATDLSTRVQMLLEYSTFYVFGGEESYGYLASDCVRDKDANAAILMFCELLADLKKHGLTLDEYLDGLYLKYGYYLESLVNLYFEGAAGSQKIQNILKSYAANPPVELDGVKVNSVTDFAKDNLEDADGKPIPKEKFFFLELENGYQFAARGSGTEPKIKFYCFAREEVTSESDLASAKQRAATQIENMKAAIEADARRRAEG